MLRNPAFRRLPRATAPRAAPLPPRRTFLSARSDSSSGRAVESLNVRELARKSHDYQRNRRIFLWSGAFAGIFSFLYTGHKLYLELQKPAQLDSSLPSSDPLSGAGAAERKVVVRDEDGRDVVPTGNTTVPTFPRTITIPTTTAAATTPSSPATDLPTEYTLVGLGTRTVTFIGIQVYVVGYYIATADIAALQNALTKKINPLATSLVPGEREELRSALLDHVEGERTWDGLLAGGVPARSVFRLVPVRDTDFHHLRDGLVTAIKARAPAMAGAEDESFGEAMKQFRTAFNRGSVPKKKELLLIRDGQGRLSIEYNAGGKSGKKRQLVGTVDDERVSRALWLNYLAGAKVASEPARASIVEGIMEFVERPVGTVAAQVV
jgi:hypothetical protein